MNDLSIAETFRDQLHDLPDYTDRDALIDERARDLAADAFDEITPAVDEWLEQADIRDELLIFAYAAICPTVATRESASLAIDRLRDRYVEERWDKYVDEASQ